MMRKNNYFNNDVKGLTLIEMLVAVTIFAILVGAISGIFISGIKIQRRILTQQELISQASYIMDYLSRSIRMARKQTSEEIITDCLFFDGLNYLNYEIPNEYQDSPTSGSGIKFINYEDTACEEFYLDSGSGQLMEKKDALNDVDDYELSLTSSKIQVIDFKVSLSGASQSDDLQPMVTLFLEVSSGGVNAKVQTSVSQRNLDKKY